MCSRRQPRSSAAMVLRLCQHTSRAMSATTVHRKAAEATTEEAIPCPHHTDRDRRCCRGHTAGSCVKTRRHSTLTHPHTHTHTHTHPHPHTDTDTHTHAHPHTRTHRSRTLVSGITTTSTTSTTTNTIAAPATHRRQRRRGRRLVRHNQRRQRSLRIMWRVLAHRPCHRHGRAPHRLMMLLTHRPMASGSFLGLLLRLWELVQGLVQGLVMEGEGVMVQEVAVVP